MTILKPITLAVILIFTAISSLFSQSPTNVTIEVKPKKVYIEVSESKQILNFDFLVTNTSTDTIALDFIKVSVFDKEDNLLQTKFLDHNGTAPSILVLPKRIWNGKAENLLFNPFSEFEITTTIHKLEFQWVFINANDEETTLKTIIYPENSKDKSGLNFPIKGKTLVYDAHDYNSHHRRFDYSFTPIKSFGIKSNFMRYAYDFVIVNKENEQFINKGENNKDYFSFGHTVQAVADGTVLYVSNHHNDDKKFDFQKLNDNPLELYGNCIAIQHTDNTISVYGHLMHNSITVKVGDTTKSNQTIAKIGVSGSSYFPHLHFELRTAISHDAEGIPSYFKDIYLIEGVNKKKLKSGFVATGNIIETK